LRRSGSRSIINVSSTGAVYAPRQSQPHSDGDSYRRNRARWRLPVRRS
jgi:hypothetical protein